MQVSRRFCRSSSALTRAARPLVSQAYVLPTRTRSYASKTPATKDADDDFIVPSDWDLEFLKKFDVPVPTAEQLARAEPSPLELPGRVGELASELFEVSSVYGTIEAVASDLQNIREFANNNIQFAEFVEEKSNGKKEIRAMFEELSKNMSPVTRKFLARLVENGDFHRLLGLADNFDELIRAYKREVNVSLYVAKLPSPEKLEVLKARVAFNHLPRGSNPIWEVKERPELLEGYSLSTKDFTIDTSLAKKKKDLQERLTAIFVRIEQASPKIAGLTGTEESFVFQNETDIQDLATALVERAAEVKELEEAHYRAHFVDWA